jgi:hypothetical protein
MRPHVPRLQSARDTPREQADCRGRPSAARRPHPRFRPPRQAARKVDRVPRARAWPSQSQETTGLPRDPTSGGRSHRGRDTITVGQRHDDAGGRPTRGRHHRQHPRRETWPDRRSMVRGANPSTDDRSLDVIDPARVRLPAVRPAKPDETTRSLRSPTRPGHAFVVVTPSSTTATRRRSTRSSTTRSGSGTGSRSRSEPTPAPHLQGETP